MAALRFLSEKINKSNLIPINAKLNIAARNYKPTANKAMLTPKFEGITNQYARVSLELQRVFGCVAKKH